MPVPLWLCSGALAVSLGCMLLWTAYRSSKSMLPLLLFALGLLSFMLGLYGFGQQLMSFETHAAHTDSLLTRAYHLQAEQEIRALLAQPGRSDPKRLGHYEHRVYSQNGEDGAIAEIFRRIGTTNKVFVEFGASDGDENNTVLLLTACGWSGVWMDGDGDAIQRAGKHFESDVKVGRLRIKETFITAENIQDLFRELQVPKEFDLLSVDIDRNDYYVWQKIEDYHPRAVVIEYSPLFPPYISWVIPYDPHAVWDGSSHTSASLKALEQLGTQKGYSLVGCSLAGVNAYFVRNDLVGDKFAAPFTAENHYEPARYFLDYEDTNHPRRPW